MCVNYEFDLPKILVRWFFDKIVSRIARYGARDRTRLAMSLAGELPVSRRFSVHQFLASFVLSSWASVTQKRSTNFRKVVWNFVVEICADELWWKRSRRKSSAESVLERKSSCIIGAHFRVAKRCFFATALSKPTGVAGASCEFQTLEHSDAITLLPSPFQTP
jgi:hypothetical protein